MRVRVIGPVREALCWQYAVENLGEAWQCVSAGEEVLLLLPCRESEEALRAVQLRPPVAPPYILGGPDGLLPEVEELPGLLAAWKRSGRLPVLAQCHLRRAEEVASALLRVLAVPHRLRAWRFLPEMIALLVVHPPLRTDLQHGLYPLIARRHGMTAAAVERSLRLCVESTWTRGSLPALERFFGASVDPERGKPTNREFLCGIAARVTQALERLLYPSAGQCTYEGKKGE